MDSARSHIQGKGGGVKGSDGRHFRESRFKGKGMRKVESMDDDKSMDDEQHGKEGSPRVRSLRFCQLPEATGPMRFGYQFSSWDEYNKLYQAYTLCRSQNPEIDFFSVFQRYLMMINGVSSDDETDSPVSRIQWTTPSGAEYRYEDSDFFPDPPRGPHVYTIRHQPESALGDLLSNDEPFLPSIKFLIFEDAANPPACSTNSPPLMDFQLPFDTDTVHDVAMTNSTRARRNFAPPSIRYWYPRNAPC